MNSITLSLRVMLVASALAGVSLLACGGDSADTTKDEAPSTGNSKDAGKKGTDAGKDAGKKDAGTTVNIPQGVPGEDCESTLPAQCDDCGENYCITQCEDGVWGECKSALGALADGGIKVPPIVTDAGAFSASDGEVSLTVGDAKVTIPPMECPEPFVCSSKAMGLSTGVISALAGGAAACVAADAIGLPPSCQTNAECTTAGFKLSQCLMNFCLQVCK